MKASLLEEHLRSLRLPTMLANYERVAKKSAEKIAYLEELAVMEAEKRKENGTRSRIAAARFPVIKTIESFDFTMQPDLPKHKVLDLFVPTFIEQRRNAVFIGTTGVGKTHLASALGVWACTNGFRTAFTTAADLLMSLMAAKRSDRLKARLTIVERYDLLIVDELGYIPFEREATDLLFQVIAGRYERGSVVITTNLAFPQWGNVFPDAMAASAVVDRIVHHAAVFELTGESHRLRLREKATGKSGGK
jgi:DNA replication protein DnaC